MLEFHRRFDGIRRRRLLKILLPLLAAWPFVAWAAAQQLIVRVPLAHADVIFVFSGSAAYVERMHKAAELFRDGRAPVILLTDDRQPGGWSSAEQRNPFFVERARNELISAGVPAEKIEILPQVIASTYDEASALRGYVDAHGLRSVLAVTSAYHARRALWTVRRVFAGENVEAGIETAAPGSPSTPSPATWWLRPSGWPAVAGEYLKLVFYWFRYR